MIAVSADTRDLSYALTRLALAAKQSLADVMKQETKYLVREVLRFTPPKSKKQGQDAVHVDIGRVANPLDADKLDAAATGKRSMFKSLAKYVRTRQHEKIEAMMARPQMRGFEGRRLLQDGRALAAAHVSLRNKRGKVPRNSLYVAHAEDVRALEKEVKRRVGWAAAGWQMLAMQCGADELPGAKTWARNLRFVAGRSRTNFTAKGNPFVEAIAFNTKIPGYQRMIDGAIASRLRSTDRKIEAVIKGRAVNLGFVRVGPSAK